MGWGRGGVDVVVLWWRGIGMVRDVYVLVLKILWGDVVEVFVGDVGDVVMVEVGVKRREVWVIGEIVVMYDVVFFVVCCNGWNGVEENNCSDCGVEGGWRKICVWLEEVGGIR